MNLSYNESFRDYERTEDDGQTYTHTTYYGYFYLPIVPLSIFLFGYAVKKSPRSPVNFVTVLTLTNVKNMSTYSTFCDIMKVLTNS